MATLVKQILDTYAARLYYINDDELQDWKLNQVLPDSGFYLLEKISLIQDRANNSLFLIGDYSGDALCYGFTLKFFLYSSDRKVLGSMKYVADARLDGSQVNGNYLQTGDGFVIYGYFQSSQGDAKECFLFTTEKFK